MGTINKLSGQIEADETFIGGKARNMHRAKREAKITGTGGKDKTAVMGILEPSVEPFHLFRYLDEQAFRYNHRKGFNDGERFDLAVRQIVGKRLTWDQLTWKTDEAVQS